MRDDCQVAFEHRAPIRPNLARFNRLMYPLRQVAATGQPVFINGVTVQPEDFKFLLDRLQQPTD